LTDVRVAQLTRAIYTATVSNTRNIDLDNNSNNSKCGPIPNVMVALPNIGGALCSTPRSLADAQYWSAAAKTLKFAGMPHFFNYRTDLSR